MSSMCRARCVGCKDRLALPGSLVQKSRYTVVEAGRPTLLRILTARWLQAKEWWNATCAATRAAFLLLALIAISLTTMPITQGLWAWDGYLHGGQDFEIGAFLILSSFCLVLVVARSCKSVLECRLTDLREIDILCQVARLARCGHSDNAMARVDCGVKDSSLSGINVLLQI